MNQIALKSIKNLIIISKNIIFFQFKDIKSLYIKCYTKKDFDTLFGYIKCLRFKNQLLFRRHSTVYMSMSPKLFSKKLSTYLFNYLLDYIIQIVYLVKLQVLHIIF